MFDIGRKGSLRQHLIRGFSGSIVLKVTNIALSFFLAVLLARVLGVKHFGIYAFCLSVVQILTVPAMLGGRQLLVREIAAYKTKGDFHLLRGVVIWFQQSSLLISLFLSVVAAWVGWNVYEDYSMLIPFLIATLLLPIYTIMQLQGAVLRGLYHVLLGQAALMLRPGLVIVIVIVIFTYFGKNLEAEAALSAQIVSSTFLVAFIYYAICRSMPQQAKNETPKYESSRWIKSILPLVFTGGMAVLNREASLFLLGVMQESEKVGLFRVAQRGALLMPIGLNAVNMTIAPTISELYTKGDIKKLQKIINNSMIVIVTLALPVALLLILGGKWIIPWIFGTDYASAYVPMSILCFGQLFNIGLGSNGMIMSMIGLERYAAKGIAIAAVCNITLNLILIPYYSTIGAAMATSINLMIWNVLLFWWLYRNTGIVSTIFYVR
jgi:O-antigen/teichoic acid export membrane protein